VFDGGGEVADLVIGMIGAGNMAEALLRGLLGRAVVSADRIWVTNRSNRERLLGVGARYGVRVTPAKAPLLDAASVLILAVKPRDAQEVLGEMAGAVRPDQLVISVIAGLPLATLEAALPGVPVIRAMPNTSAAVLASATALTPGRHATPEHRDTAIRIFEAVGEVVVVSEDALDVITGLSGSGPAYVYRLIEAMIHAGTDLGLSGDLARRLAVQTLVGAARMLAESSADPAELRQRVTSPGGTTMAALGVLEDRGFARAVRDAISRAAERAREMAAQYASRPAAPPGEDSSRTAGS
jgi:pyrroline-5-carboxylate reductase